MVERFGYFPRQSFGDAGALQVACGEIDAQSHFGVIARGKTFADRTAHAVDLDDQFRFVMYFPAEIGHVERVVVAQ